MKELFCEEHLKAVSWYRLNAMIKILCELRHQHHVTLQSNW